MAMIIDGTNGLTFNDSSTQTKGVSSVNPVFTGDASISGLTVGKGAGSNSISTVVGNAALAGSNTGIANSAFGVSTLNLNTSGGYNTALGGYVLAANTTGANNSATGYGAMYANTTGGNNVANGYQSLFSNTTASNNTAVGYQAGYTNTTGTQNVYLGNQAGYTSNANYNTFVGYQTGITATGGFNTFLGYGAGYSMTTGTKNTILGVYNGNQGGLDIRTASNYIVLSDGDGNPRAYWNNEGLLTTTSTTNDQAFAAYRQRTTSGGTVVSFYSDYTATKKLITQFTSEGAAYSLSGTWGTISDQSLKENIVDATPKLNDINKLKVRNFNFIGAEDKQLGFVAQEIEQVFPAMVATGEDGYKTVKTSILIPALVKAIQELNAKVEAQALEIATLKGQ